MKLKVWAFGLGCGIVWGATIFLATVLRVLQEGGQTLSLLSAFYWGYSVSWIGAFVGLAWGFINGLIGGAVLALIYNALAKAKTES